MMSSFVGTKVQVRSGVVRSNLRSSAVARNVKPATKAGVKQVASKGGSNKNQQYICLDCGWIYVPSKFGGKSFDAQPDNFRCPTCQAPKRRFKPYNPDGAEQPAEAEGNQAILIAAAVAFAFVGAAYFFASK